MQIGILGSTGSIGRQTLDVVRAHPHKYDVKILSAHKNIELLQAQIEEFQPEYVFVTDQNTYDILKESRRNIYFEWDFFPEALAQLSLDMIVGAIGGAAGLVPSFQVLEAGIDLALANKETLVAGGDLVKDIQKRTGAQIIPVDSEHSAIFQCLEAENPLEKIIITASGGPFRTWSREALKTVQLEDALRHPSWSMGKKITIDSSTLMNKGLEVIEAHHLFDISYDDIEVVIHPESIIHSMVQYADGSILAQMGCVDMKVPIQVALTWPKRIQNHFERLDFKELQKLTFEQPRFDDFPALTLAYDAGKAGGSMPAVMNAANEEATFAFLDKKIAWSDIYEITKKTMLHSSKMAIKDLETLLAIDAEARVQARAIIAERYRL